MIVPFPTLHVPRDELRGEILPESKINRERRVSFSRLEIQFAKLGISRVRRAVLLNILSERVAECKASLGQERTLERLCLSEMVISVTHSEAGRKCSFTLAAFGGRSSSVSAIIGFSRIYQESKRVLQSPAIIIMRSLSRFSHRTWRLTTKTEIRCPFCVRESVVLNFLRDSL